MTVSDLREVTAAPDLRTREARAAQQYVGHKGYKDARPFGVLAVAGASYFYYDLPDGLLELEIAQDDESPSGGFRRTATCFRGRVS